MRRIFSVILAFLLLANLCGCAAQPSNEIQTTPTSSATPDTTVPTADRQPQIQQQPMIAASLPIVEQNYTAEDGQILLKHVYQNLELIVPDQEVADAIIIDFLNRTDKWHTSAESLYTEVAATYNSSDFREPFLSQITFEPARLDRSIFSLMGNSVTHKGHAHPEVTAESVTYDLATGKVLAFSDILQSDTDTNILYDQILRALQKQADVIAFYESYENTVSALLTNPTNWYFSENGLVFYYSPYEIAPYSSGVIYAEIEYKNLTKLLNDAYFPAESDITNGQLLAAPLQINDTDPFSQIAELVCNESSKQVVLYTEGLLEEIRITHLRSNGEYTVFASPHVTPGDGIVIYLAEKDTLQIQYKTNGEQTSKALYISSDGTPQLKD